MGKSETVPREDIATGVTFDEFKEGASVGFVGRRIEKDSSLIERRVVIRRDQPAVTRFHVGRESERERENADLGAAGLCELRGLGDIFAVDEFGFELVIDAGVLESGNGGAAVGGVIGIGDGDFLNARIAQGGESRLGEIEMRVSRSPENDLPASIKEERIGVGETSVDQLLYVEEISGKEEIEGRTVLNLREEIATGAVADGKFLAGLLLIVGGEIVHGELQIGGGGDVDGLGADGWRE